MNVDLALCLFSFTTLLLILWYLCPIFGVMLFRIGQAFYWSSFFILGRICFIGLYLRIVTFIYAVYLEYCLRILDLDGGDISFQCLVFLLIRGFFCHGWHLFLRGIYMVSQCHCSWVVETVRHSFLDYLLVNRSGNSFFL